MLSTLLTSAKLKVFTFYAMVLESCPLLICDLSTEMLSHAKCGGDMACSHLYFKIMIL